MRADGTSFSSPEIPCVSIFCFVARLFSFRPRIPSDGVAKNVGRGTCRFFARAAECVL